MLLCILSLNFMPIADILKEIELQSRPSDLAQAYHGKFPQNAQKLTEHGHYVIAICFKLLCIIPPNFRLISEIFKDLERWPVLQTW